VTSLLLDHLWQSTLAALAAWLLVVALRNHEARVRYWIWFAASLKFVVPFAALVAIGKELGWLSTTTTVRVEAGWIEVAAQPMAALEPVIAPDVLGAVADVGVTAAAILVIVWLAGIALVLGRWFVRWLRLNRVVRSATPLALRQLDGSGIEARLSQSRIEPGIAGVFKSVLILPDGILQRLSPQQLDAVVAHELCHARRRDNLTAALHMAVEAVLWFHPLVWWIGTRLVEERERACDEAVVAAGADAGEYAQGILEVCRFYLESPLECAAGIGGGAALKHRVRRIAEQWTVRRSGATLRAVLGAGVLVLLGAPVVIGALTAPRAYAQGVDATTPRFASVSIERSAGQCEGDSQCRSLGSWSNRGSSMEVQDVPLRKLVAYAYDLQDYEVAGGPELDSRHYTITARAAASPVEQDDFRHMTRALLAESFGLEAHAETERVPALVLRRSATASAELRRDYGWSTSHYMGFTQGALEFRNLPLRGLHEWLSIVYGKPVVDETGLTGNYTFTLRWETPTLEPTQETAARELEAQLGLSLTDEPRRVERLVVDRVAQPAAE
jgi:bla regulator protein blaR1